MIPLRSAQVRARHFLTTFSLLLITALSAGCLPPALPPVASGLDASGPPAPAAPPKTLLHGMTLPFEVNQGQLDTGVAYRARGAGFAVDVAAERVQLHLADPTGQTARVTLQWEGGQPAATISGRDPLPGKIHYLTGQDPAQWRTHVATFGRVRLAAVYPGIDLEIYGNRQAVEYDFIVAPGAEPAAIRLRFDGENAPALDPAGNLILNVAGRPLLQHKPLLYQTIDGARRAVSGAFRVHADQSVGFVVGDYDRTQPLVIDPLIAFSTYLGGTGGDEIYGVEVDAAGNIYVAGRTTSGTLAADLGATPPRAYAGTSANTSPEGDAFVAKLTPDGSELVYFTYLGGANGDAAYALALDEQGRAAVTGTTRSLDFPVSGNAFQGTAPGRQPGDEYIYQSTNGGASWTEGGNGIASAPSFAQEQGNLVHALVVDPQTPTTIYAATRLAVFKSTDSGTTWQPRANGLSSENTIPGEYETLSLAIVRDNPATLYAGTFGRGLFKTTNGGDVWTSVSAGFSGTLTNTLPYYVPSVAVDPVNPQIVHAATASEIFRSDDGGTSWQPAALPTPSPPPTSVAVSSNDTPDTAAGALAYRPTYTGAITSLVVAPSDANIVYAGTDRRFGVLKSSDRGLSYTRVYTSASIIVYTLAVHPTNPNVVYAATDDAFAPLLKSSDGGVSWDVLDDENGLPFAPDIMALAIDPTTPNTVYAGIMDRGVYKTTNGGANWEEVSDENFLNDDVRALALDPTDPAKIYAGTESRTGPRSASADIFVAQLSADGAGLSYATYFGGFGRDEGRSIAYGPNGHLWIAGYTDSDGLATSGVVQATRGGELDYVVARFDPAQSGAASLRYATYVGGSDVEGERLVASDGNTFRSVRSAALVVDGAGDAYLTGFTSSDDFPVTSNAFDGSFNGGQSDAILSRLNPDGTSLRYSTYFGSSGSAPTNFPGLANTHDIGFALDLDGTGNVYVAGESKGADMPVKNALQPQYGGNDHLAGDGFIAKFNLGQSGAASLVYATYLGGARDDGITALDVSDDGVVAMAGFTRSTDFPVTLTLAVVCQVRGGIYKTSDGGDNWRETGKGLPTNEINTVAVHPTVSNVLLAGGEDSRFGDLTRAESRGGLFRSTDAGATWKPITAGVTIPAINAITYDSADPQTVYLAAGGRFTETGEAKEIGGIFKSTDGGLTWTALPDLPTAARYMTVIVDPADSDILYTIHEGILKSTDGGATWNPANTGLPAEPTNSYHLVVAATDPPTLYALARGFNIDNDGLYKSTNRGGNWSLATTQQFTSTIVNDLVVDPVTPTTLYASVLSGVVKSTDGGATWNPINTGLPDPPEPGLLAIDPQAPMTIYVAEGNSGAYAEQRIYKTTDGGANWTLANNGFPFVDVLDLVVAPGQSGTVYAATSQNITVDDLFVAELDASGQVLNFASYLGGGSDENANDLAAAGDNLYVVGATNSADFPTTSDALQPAYAAPPTLDSNSSASRDGFVTQIDLLASQSLCADQIFLPVLGK